MATLSAGDLLECRKALERDAYKNNTAVTWSKSQMDAIAQAVEDALVAAGPAINAAINGAGGSGLSDAQKRQLVSYVIKQKFMRDKGA